MNTWYTSEVRVAAHRYLDKKEGAKAKLMKVLETTDVYFRHELMANDTTVRWGGWSVLHESAYTNDIEIIKLMLGGSFDEDKLWEALSFTSNYGNTPLHWAAINGCEDAVRCLLDFTPKEFRYEYLVMKGGDGDSVLHAAARYNHLQVLKILLSFVSQEDQLKLLGETNDSEETDELERTRGFDETRMFKLTNDDNKFVKDFLFEKYPHGLPEEMRGTTLADVVGIEIKDKQQTKEETAPLPDVVQAEQPMSATEESEIRQQPTIVHAEQTSELVVARVGDEQKTDTSMAGIPDDKVGEEKTTQSLQKVDQDDRMIEPAEQTSESTKPTNESGSVLATAEQKEESEQKAEHDADVQTLKDKQA